MDTPIDLLHTFYSVRVQELHHFSIKTRILEVGCGVALLNMLLSENNASHTLYDGYTPYDRDAQMRMDTHLSEHRAVSVENTYLMLMHSMENCPENMIHYVANFQIGGNPDKNQTTHGYIAIAGLNGSPTYCYHITIPGEGTRSELMTKIARVGFSLLWNKQLEYFTSKEFEYEPLPINHVDQVFQPKRNKTGSISLNPDVEKTLELFLGESRPTDSDNFLCYHKGEFHRFEDFFRNKKKIMFYRGTFNPITKAHMAVVDKANEYQHPDISCLMIAEGIYGKPGLSLTEIKQRMAYADALDMPLVIAHSYRYLDGINHFRKRTFYNMEIELQFIMGADTVQRVFESEPKDFYLSDALNQVTYLYVKRIGFDIKPDVQLLVDYLGWPNKFLMFKPIPEFHEDEFVISATQARQYLKEGNYAELQRLLPKVIYDLFILKGTI